MSLAKEERDPDLGGGKTETTKTSMQILSELFGSFDAEPPVIVKKEKTEGAKKHKKSKKKRKHKEKKHEKKHKKKTKKKKRSSSSSSSGSSSDEGKEVLDLAQLLIKQEKDKTEEKIKIEGTSLSLGIKLEINKNREDQKDKSAPEEPKSKSKKDVKKDVKQEEKPKKHKHKEKSRKRKSTTPEKRRSKEKRAKYEEPFDLRQKLKQKSSPERKHSDSSRSQRRDRSRDKYSHREDHRSRYRERESSPPHKEDSFYKPRDRSRSRSRDRWISSRERYRSRDRSIDNQRRVKEDKSRFDKKKLLEIARKNAVQMMKSGSLPGALTLGSRAQEKMIAAIKSGGKTVEELTDFCKSLSKKEELGELSSLSENDDSETDEAFHHPFKLKDRPTNITMNIKNAVPLPTKTTQERTSELRIQFPVSSGQQHRVNEEWVPVATPKAIEASKPKPVATITNAPLPIEAAPDSKLTPAPPNAPPGPQIFPSATDNLSAVDISSIVTQRLTAMRKLQENPNDVQALTEMYKSNKEMDVWAKSKQQFGQFTGSTGVQVLTQAELASGYQAWAKKDQLQTAAPVSGGMGMHLLQKMGWKPGEGLGKEKTGSLEPLLLQVKLDKKGLVADEEQTRGKKKPKAVQTVKTLQGKHPVSLLGEYASKRKLGAPQYLLEFECGPDHKKNFLFKVLLNGIEYKPNVASANKKEAKAFAATLALKQIGLLV